MTDLDPKWFDLSLQLVQTLFFVIVGVIAWVNSKGKAASSEVKKVEQKLDASAKKTDAAIDNANEKRREDRKEIEQRISDDKQDLINRIDSLKSDLVKRVDTVEIDVRALRENVKHLPGDVEMKELHDRITTLSENLGTRVGELGGTMKAVNSTVTRISDYLMNKKG